ncbi:hypothetical protein SH601_05485 [Gracilibacillus sp. S3-1-1]|uniref:Uncharacterized protein n=1 Tax=Gracilibacillus pellucidus TaxID=3095368 RepID=A0ACC6M3M4_9BACI|nr:hypothetical protein [Gracilibacillus sp. S3-1-1]MDX8045437.1 hypothetical protein [Gracilibacillus sp. S3-1-1]
MNKPYQEFEVNGNDYKLYYDVASIKKYIEITDKYQLMIKSFLKKPEHKLTDRDRNKVYQASKYALDGFFGKGSFKTIYQSTDNDLDQVADVINDILDWLNGKVKELEQKGVMY